MYAPNKQVDKSYKGCDISTGWMKKTYEYYCLEKGDLSEIDFPKNILFFFEGAGDFNARKANQTLNPINIDGTEGKDFGLGNGNGLNSLVNIYKNSRLNLREKIELHYHAGSGYLPEENFYNAIACSKQIFEMQSIIQEEIEFDFNLITIGYSNGAALSVAYQNWISRMNRSVELAMTIDPVAQILAYPIFKLKKTIGKRNIKTKRFINVYQNSDFGSLPVFRLRGKPVKNADLNKLLKHSDIDSGLNESGRANHVLITRSRFVTNLLTCELDNLVNEKFHYCF